MYLISGGNPSPRSRNNLISRKWEGDKYEDDDFEGDEESKKLVYQQSDALEALEDTIYGALLSRNSVPANLEAAVLEEIRKRPVYLEPRLVGGREPSEEVQELNDKVYGVSAIYTRRFPGDLLDSALNTGILYTSLGPCEMNYNEEGMYNHPA